MQFSSTNQGQVLVILMETHILSNTPHKVQCVILTVCILESEGTVSYLYVGGQGVSEVGNIVW